MHRFYADCEEDGLVRLNAEDTAHAARVLRLRSGDAAEIILRGARHAARAVEITPERALFRLEEALPTTEPRLRVTLFQGLPKGDKLELIVQKAVELGAAAVVPVEMSRCVARMDPKQASRRQERWQRIAREAGKQAGRCLIPEVGAPIPFRHLLEELPAFDAAAVPYEEETAGTLTGFCRSLGGAVRLAVVIGPEGGIAPEEIEALRAAGCCPVTLGPRILRTETAGLAALAALMALSGEWDSRA